jgi:hypothetical protein
MCRPDTVMEMYGANARYSAVKSFMHSILTEDQDAQLNAAHRMIQISKLCTIRRWSDSKHMNGKPVVRLVQRNTHLVDLKWTEEEQATLKTLVERYTSQGASGVWRVHRWRLACFSLVLEDNMNRNEVSVKWYINGHSILWSILRFSDG